MITRYHYSEDSLTETGKRVNSAKVSSLSPSTRMVQNSTVWWSSLKNWTEHVIRKSRFVSAFCEALCILNALPSIIKPKWYWQILVSKKLTSIKISNRLVQIRWSPSESFIRYKFTCDEFGRPTNHLFRFFSEGNHYRCQIKDWGCNLSFFATQWGLVC